MQRQKKRHLQLDLFALFSLTLMCAIAPLVSRKLVPVLHAATNVEKAQSADSFVDSIGVVTHWGYSDTPYGNYDSVKQKLVDLGIRHVRDGGSRDSDIAKMKDLANLGIKTTFVLDPNGGTAPNSSYWANPPAYSIHDFVKKVGTKAIDAVEMSNEIDLNYSRYSWHKGESTKLSNDPKSSLYWAAYIRVATADTWKALKNDPATAGTSIIGPSLGETYDGGAGKPNPLDTPTGGFASYVDFGNFHPYPGGGNPFSDPFSYDTIDKYYWHGNFPAINIDEWPYAFNTYRPPFGSKPMIATETGYDTSKNNISEKMHGKYIPRLFLEYFRKGIVRTFSYEFVDEFTDPNYGEGNYGLLHHDLSPKPAYTALKNIIGLLKDPGSSFKPGSLNYAIAVNPPPSYSRTQYVHHLLLQKRDGKFYLLLWHEISNGDITSKPVREIAPPVMPVTLTLNQSMRSATIYSLDDSGNMSSKSVSTSSPIKLNVPDKATIVQLVPNN